MTAVEKFLFNYDFDRPPVNDRPEDEDMSDEEAAEPEPEIIVPTFSEEEVAAARDEGFAAGKEQGIRETLAGAEQTTATALESITEKINGMFRRQDEANTSAVRDAINVAAAITRKMFPHFSNRGAAEEVEQVIQSIMEKVIDEPRLTITVSASLHENISARLGPIISETGFEGKVVLNAEETLPPGDCRIEWGTGTASRDTEALWREIDFHIAENMPSADGPSADGSADRAESVESVRTGQNAESPSSAGVQDAENDVQSKAATSAPPDTRKDEET
ncbi:MAG: FliH/SctL family protein [Rhodospirillales bacterium]